MDVPGGPHFRDVTRLFDEASKDMALEELLMVDGFSLFEAMSAVEIGDPRMDSGATLPADEQRPIFDPLTPLLPEEVCWILDRTLACEMHWHAGNSLAQTVFTCLYMHHLSTISPDYITPDCASKFALSALPIELVSIVVRAGVVGMVKCCDLAYRELIKGNVHDCEDWQGDKSEIPLYEMVLPQRIIATLEEAEVWLMSAQASNLPCQEELIYRIQLRKTLLRLFALELPRKTPFIFPLIAEARRLLDNIKRWPVNPPMEGSSAYTAFDSRITRQLNSIIPIRPLTLPPQEEAWKAIEGLLDGWELIYLLSGCESLLAWNTIGLLNAGSPRRTLTRLPFIRSVAQSIFSNGAGIMDRFPIHWLVEQFLLEIAYITPGHSISLFEDHSSGLVLRPYEEFHDTLARLLLQHIWSSYHNRPQQRRHHMKTSIDWHLLYDAALSVTAKVTPQDTSESRILKCIPLAVLHWRADIIRDIVLSGFELGLYAPDERSFAYWYLSQVFRSHESIIRELLNAVPQGSPAHGYLTAQSLYVMLLREMSFGCFIMLSRKSPFDVTRRWTNFTVRYKWVLKPEFASLNMPDPFLPDYRAFLKQERSIISEEQGIRREKAASAYERASVYLVHLGLAAESDPSLQLCRVEFVQHHLAGLLLSCESLKAAVSTASATGDAADSELPLDRLNLVWDQGICSWFPQVQPLNPSGEATVASTAQIEDEM